MHYYIDGYNLLFSKPYSKHNLMALRHQLIQELNEKADLLQLEITIVFDAQYQLGDVSKSHFHHIEILYSAYGELADDLILSEVRASSRPRQITVVTSDKKLAWFARRCEAKTESIGDFIKSLDKRYLNKQRRVKLEPPLQKAALKSAQKTAPLKKAKTPDEKASFTECYQYYLEQFETKLVEEMQKPAPRTAKKTKRSLPVEPSESDAGSEQERWLRIFEKRLNKS